MVTAPQCIECAERRMRVQSMEARCFLGMILRHQKNVYCGNKKGIQGKTNYDDCGNKRMVIVATKKCLSL